DGGADAARGTGDQDDGAGMGHRGCSLGYAGHSPRRTTAMHPHTDLPEPAPGALHHSGILAAHIRGEIRHSGRALPMSRFMELCPYAPGLGYYSAGSTKFGPAGDFVTAPEIGRLFAATVSGVLAEGLRQLGGHARVLEVGGGSGAFAEV